MDLIGKVKRMRELQKQFFSGNRSAITEAKRLEKEVDDELARLSAPADMFDDSIGYLEGIYLSKERLARLSIEDLRILNQIL